MFCTEFGWNWYSISSDMGFHLKKGGDIPISQLLNGLLYFFFVLSVVKLNASRGFN